MKTDSRRDVEVDIGVMHTVQAPEKWHDVQEAVLPVDCDVQQQDANNDGGDWRQRLQQPAAGRIEPGGKIEKPAAETLRAKSRYR